MFVTIKCNGKINPVGIYNKYIRFNVESENVEKIKGVEYKFFKSREDVKIGNFFQTKKSKGRQITIDFENAKTGEEIFVKAYVSTSDGVIESEVSKFEFALSEEDADVQWMENPNFDMHVSEYQKTFTVDGEVTKARLYVTGLGYYFSSINGKKTDEEYFKPLLSDYDKREKLGDSEYENSNFKDSIKTVYYNAYDVTDLIKTGENRINLLVGGGWYHNTDKDITDPTFNYGNPKAFFKLFVYGDGFTKVIESDGECLVRNTNAISQMFKGNEVDFSAEPLPFVPVKLCDAPQGKLLPATFNNDVVMQVIEPIEKTQNDGKVLYDFGKNHSGGLRLKVKGKKGDKIVINHYETLKDGKPNPVSSRWGAYLNSEILIGYLDQTSTYVLSGEEDVITPLFHWDCYRYAEIEKSDDVEILEIQSLFICSNVEFAGNFRCSVDVFNKLYNAFVLTQLDNMHSGVPSDCPHREKLPYTGDGHITSKAVMYAFDAEEFYRKWIKDIFDSQGKDGFIHYSAPFMSGGGGYWWCNAVSIVPLNLYSFTGDKKIIEQAFDHAVRFAEHCTATCDGDYILRTASTQWLLGDWLAPEVIKSNVSFVNTVAYYASVDNVIRMCDILDEQTTKARMEKIRENIKNGINRIFFDKENLNYGNGEQGENVFPLVYNIVPEEYKKALWEKVANHYKETGHFDTGIVLTPIVLDALTENGYADIAYELMTVETYPSYYSMLKDETTLSEHWSKYWPTVSSKEGVETPLEGDVSHCHPMFGSVVAWLYRHVAGLDLDKLCNGKITIAPKYLHKAYRALATRKTYHGLVSVEYDSSSAFNMKLTVPHGLEAEVRIPLSVCESFYVIGDEFTKSRKKDGYSYLKLTGGEWNLTSSLYFGGKI